MEIHINENFAQTESQSLQLQKCEKCKSSVWDYSNLYIKKNRSDSPADRPESEEEGVSTWAVSWSTGGSRYPGSRSPRTSGTWTRWNTNG